MKLYHWFFCPLLVMVFLVASGCSGGYKGGERLYPVTITVTKNGSPFEDATVVLVREGGTKIINAGGITDQNGIAKIKVDAQWDGVPEGKYKVAVGKSSSVEGDLSTEEYKKLGLLEKEAYDQKMAKKLSSVKLLVPEVIARTATTPLTIDVTSSGNNSATFDIDKY